MAMRRSETPVTAKIRGGGRGEQSNHRIPWRRIQKRLVDSWSHLAWVVSCGLFFLLMGMGCGVESRGTWEMADEDLRIVSLSPAFTQVLNEIGLGEAVVGVGDFDEVVRPGVPSVGRYVDLDLERLLMLEPTHVLAVAGVAKLPAGLEKLALRQGFVVEVLAYPENLEEALAGIVEVAAAVGRESRGQALADGLRFQLDGIARLTAGRERTRAMMVFSVPRVMALGRGTVNDDLLRIAGGENAAVSTRVSAPIFDREALVAAGPEAVFLMLPGHEPSIGPSDARLEAFRGLGLPAMETGRVVVLNDPGVLLPGPSLATTAYSMAAVLHPELAESMAGVFRDTP